MNEPTTYADENAEKTQEPEYDSNVPMPEKECNAVEPEEQINTEELINNAKVAFGSLTSKFGEAFKECPEAIETGLKAAEAYLGQKYDELQESIGTQTQAVSAAAKSAKETYRENTKKNEDCTYSDTNINADSVKYSVQASCEVSAQDVTISNSNMSDEPNMNEVTE